MDRLGKSFEGNSTTKEVLRDVSVVVRPAEVVAIRGDNGTGKTTLLNIMVGIEAPTTGTARCTVEGGDSVRVGYVQQDYTSSLLPWLDVLDNIAIPLQLRDANKAERRTRANQLLDSLGFNMLPRDAYPHQLSGGQKQRVALARALIHHPHLLILDEPFANLDAHTIRDLQQTLSRLHEDQRPTVLFVSHDLDQVFLADRVLLLHGSPATIAADFSVPLPRPRSREMILGGEYAGVRSEILAFEEKLYAKAR